MNEETIRLYRVETPDNGDGPYAQYHNRVPGMCDAHEDDTHPDPWQDGILYSDEHENYNCAFSTLGALREWFRGWGESLTEYKKIVAVYEVPVDRVVHGRRQVMFERGELRPVQRWTASEIIT